MWIAKISRSLLCFHTSVGPRYADLTFSERFAIAWMFRHFSELPLGVLTESQKRKVEELRARATEEPATMIEGNVIGTLDCTLAKKPAQRVVFEKSKAERGTASEYESKKSSTRSSVSFFLD